jgi:uncharacterized damage-inducible protein DinB
MLPEVWLRGPITDIPPLLQPVAHALLEAREEVSVIMEGFPEESLWKRPAGVASPGFHLQHLAGVLDRMCTYARGESLSEDQIRALAAEGKADASLPIKALLDKFYEQVDRTLVQLKATREADLAGPCCVGRAQLPSTVVGVLFHAAEHTMRHVGQLFVTVRVLR